MVHPISTRGSTEKESEKNKESEEHRTKKQKNAEKKRYPCGFEPQLQLSDTC